MIEFSTKEMLVFAKEMAIKFAKFISSEGWQQYDETDRWIAPSDSNKVYTTKQLYERFENKK